MLDHIVLFKLRDGIEKEAVEELHSEFLGLEDKIPGIVSITGGTDVSTEGKNQGYTLGFVVRFEDANARDKYLPHPAHRCFVEKHVRPIIRDALVLDYEVGA